MWDTQDIFYQKRAARPDSNVGLQIVFVDDSGQFLKRLYLLAADSREEYRITS